VLEALLTEKGMAPDRHDIVADDYQSLMDAIRKAVAEHDMVLINAGSSAGSEDYTKKLIQELGTVYFHGINIRPGKPTVLGEIDGKPVIGIPGFPVSAYIVYEMIVEKLIDRLYGQQLRKPTVKAILSRRLMSSIKNEEYVRVKLGKVEDKIIASPLNRGAGVTMSLVRADGVLMIPKHVEGLEAGTEVIVELMEQRTDLDHTIVSIGSHDIILDMLTSLIGAQGKGMYFTSSHQGSLAGIMALRRGAAHLAPVHLLDEKTGIYNEAFLKRYLDVTQYVLVKGLKRSQGLYVEKGNPKAILGISDLTRSDVIFVNRQKGSGTRVLLDYLIKKNTLLSEDISGYEREMNTHMTVAAAVLSGTADVTMGIESVAKVMGLGFIPIGEEDYDFIIKRDELKTDKIKTFMEVLVSEDFKVLVGKMEGYRFVDTGHIVEIG
jgi:putative molybdopterin biosynthesis protein